MHLLNFCLEAGSVQDRLHVGHTGSHTIHHAQDQRSQGQTVAHSTVPQHRLSPIAIGYPPTKNTDLTWTWLENHHVGHELYLWIGMCVFKECVFFKCIFLFQGHSRIVHAKLDGQNLLVGLSKGHLRHPTLPEQPRIHSSPCIETFSLSAKKSLSSVNSEAQLPYPSIVVFLGSYMD